jgi:glycosyltransferase involved in cell wall biosynthesis
MELIVILSAFNRPDLLPIQVESIQKNLKNNHKIIVSHDSRNYDYVKEFEDICNNLQIKFYHHDSTPGKDASRYHGEAIQWAYDNIIKTEYTDDLILILDHDMFMINELDLIEYFGDNDVLGRPQSRGTVEYVWLGLMMFKYQSVKDINFNFYPGFYFGELLDTGGGTSYILNDKNIKYKPTSVEYPSSYKGINLLDEKINLGYGFEFHLDRSFLHFRNACGWHNNMTVVPNDNDKKEVLEYILSNMVDDKNHG